MTLDLATAKLLAAAAQQAYSDTPVLPGFAVTPFLQDPQCFIAIAPGKLILAFRGTEILNPKDWATDATAKFAPSPAGGKVHKGFQHSFDKIWNTLTPILDTHAAVPLYLTGHSLGGALALLAASRIQRPLTIHTFGQPRVGNLDFATACHNRFGATYTRFINEQDIVPRVAPFTAKYRHFGHEYHIRNGILTPIDSGIETLEDALRLAAGHAIPALLRSQVLQLIDSIARGSSPLATVTTALNTLLGPVLQQPLQTFANGLKDNVPTRLVTDHAMDLYLHHINSAA